MKSPIVIVLFLIMLITQGKGDASKSSQNDEKLLRQEAFKIDQYISDFYKKNKLSVPQVADDATFMRRTFLVGMGRIPTPEEAFAFIEMQENTKRADLVRYVLSSKGYSSHMTNWAFDLLRLRDFVPANILPNRPYREWLRNAIDQNMPWDKLVTNLLASSGDPWDPKSAAVGYYALDRGMELDNLANSMRTFLGVRMECAQCHDDPFSETEQRDFYHLAAFTHDQGPVSKNMNSLHTEIVTERLTNEIEVQLSDYIHGTIYNASIGGKGNGRIALPHDYKYRDGSPGEVIGAKTPFGKPVRLSEKEDSKEGREKLAEWVVSRTDMQFPSVIANRMWQKVMGKGIYEPVDEYIKPVDTVYPELVIFLSKLMVDLNYDLQAFQNVLMLTKTFQFATNPNTSTVEGGDDFHGRKISRLSAEQIWDSLITLSHGDPDLTPRKPLDTRIVVNGTPYLVGKMDMVRLSSEVLALESEEEARSYFYDILRQIEEERKSPNTGRSSMGMQMVAHEKYSADSPIRASELPSPAPSDHFLRVFGASERVVVEDSSKQPNVSQVLSLMNGYVQTQLVNNPKAHIYKSLRGIKSPQEKIRHIYLLILNRAPDSEEMILMEEEMKRGGKNAVKNIISALVMSSEFLFLQ